LSGEQAKQNGIENAIEWMTYLDDIAMNTGMDVELLKQMLFDRLHQMVKEVLELFPRVETRAFSLSGWDIVFDENLHPWVMEINRQPDMNPFKTSHSQYKHAMLHSLLDLVTYYAPDQLPTEHLGWHRVDF
jgi:hypothetical protein